MVPASTGVEPSLGNVAYTGNIQVDDIESTTAHGVEIDGVL